MNLEFEQHSGLATPVANEFGESCLAVAGRGASVGQYPAALDCHRDGVFALGIDGRVLFLNDFANTIWERADGLGLDGGRLRALHRSDDEHLQRLIARALLHAASGTMPLARSGGGRHYLVFVRPLPRCQPDVDKMPAILVTIADLDRTPQPSVLWLRRLFALTGAEARLVLLLFAGSTLAEAASASGISQATARVHLAHTFRKTRTARQAELIRLLMSYPWDELLANGAETALAS